MDDLVDVGQQDHPSSYRDSWGYYAHYRIMWEKFVTPKPLKLLNYFIFFVLLAL